MKVFIRYAFLENVDIGHIDIRSFNNEVSELEKLIRSCCDGVEEYKFVPLSFSSLLSVSDEKIISIEKELISDVKELSRYDKNYMSALKMTVYHEIGHDKNRIKEKHYHLKEAVAELYAIDKGSIADYVIEIAVETGIIGNKLAGLNSKTYEKINIIEDVLKHDGADRWLDPGFISEVSEYKCAKNALKKINLPYANLVNEISMETEKIETLKNKNKHIYG
jgi:hypothetical protein